MCRQEEPQLFEFQNKEEIKKTHNTLIQTLNADMKKERKEGRQDGRKKNCLFGIGLNIVVLISVGLKRVANRVLYSIVWKKLIFGQMFGIRICFR